MRCRGIGHFAAPFLQKAFGRQLLYLKRRQLVDNGNIGIIRILLSAIGGGLGIAIMALLASAAHLALVLVPFATSIVLVMGAPEAPQAQPRNIVGGHVISALCGALACAVLGADIWAAAGGVAASIALMHATRTFHPPAGINPVVMVTGNCGWGFVLSPVATGALILVAYAYLYHRLTQPGVWPRRWM
jgi:CBS-domain-containing membrane protein